MVAVHTIGTRSLANVRHDMEKRKGQKVSRTEVFKVAYTCKDGRPQLAHEVTIAKIDEKLTEEPEFVDKPIEEGDYLSNLLGKENRGRVIGIGVGPTPASLGLPGTKSTARTSLQLEREARHRAEEEVRALKEGMQQLEERIEERMERRLAEKMAEFKAMKHTSPEQRHSLNKPTEEHSCSSTSNNIQPRIVEALQLNQKRPAMKIQPRIARELQLNLNKHARKVQPRIVEESQLNHNRHDGMVQPGVARESQVNQNMHVTKDSLRRVDATCNVQQGVEKDVDNHNCTKQPKMTKKRCGETTSHK
ncbi:uncharacterized protein LOC127783333 [Oryza glaberrima]|uniref:uncharacterized protein LOC127783333 n=1 Tax=Oryza glaberrima TaxID=4538 RepID=UPI00224C48C2|nr:uncharacterized protein LOC127783333 [Oryza glaberrima]XP_052166549.1 uncharacterized protein LOC127783333 [Oryza glaberrima]XP_052166550.1 uncharacterized protein LOC127783333 [Oryza glaberrima]